VLFPELLVLAAHAEPPDLLLEGIPRARFALSGPWQPGEADKLFWVEQDTERLNVTEFVKDQLVTSRIGEGVAAPLALVDYDGDGQNNLILARGSVLADETGSVLDITPTSSHGPATGDVNGDGFGDYASLESMWMGHEEGFRQGSVFPTGEPPVEQAVHALGDLDGDGRADLARANLRYRTDVYAGALEGTLDLYLGCEFAEPNWIPHWSYDHPTDHYGPGLEATLADLDGDGDEELLVLSGETDIYGFQVTGELQVLDDLLDPSGPTVVSSQELDSPISFRLPMFHIENMGDLDGDGDDEVLIAGMDLLDPGYVRIIDAELTGGGLLQVIGPSFDLPPIFLENETILKPLVGDYDGDGWRDLALMLAEPEAGSPNLDGIIAIWLTTPPEGIQSPPPSTGTSDLSHCQPPEEGAGSTEDPPTEGTACLGCATTRAPSALILLALPCLARRRTRGPS
jgi:hypothetical protein